MDLPFVFGKIAENEDFTDRTEELQHVISDWHGLVNTIIISPRRWGKTSLVNKALQEIAKEKDFLTVHIDMFNCRTEEQFYNNYAKTILEATSSKVEEMLASVKKYLSSFGPRISMGDSVNQFEISLGLEHKRDDFSIDEILDLPQRIAEEKKKKVIVCIDEFQNVGQYEQSLAFQKQLRAHWQKHSLVSYCLYGSKRHMLLDIFGNYEMPFYKFGDILFLQKIQENEWIPYIKTKFEKGGKTISEDAVLYLVRKVDCHPFYVQQLAQATWLRTNKKCDISQIDEAHESIVRQLNLLFSNLFDSLRPRQISFLYAVADGVKNFSSKEVLEKYDLGTSANIKNLRTALLERDLIDILPNNTLVIQDPIFAYWLRQQKS